MFLDFQSISGLDAYRWLTALVTPRPIAWVSTVDLEGRANLAPFSWFQSVCSSPPILMIACGLKKGRDGQLEPKDTLRNAKNTGELVIQLARRDQAEALNASSAELPHGESEFEFAGLRAEPSRMVRAPRIAGASVAFECKVEEIQSREGWKTSLIFARVLGVHVADEHFRGSRFDAESWNPIARLGGDSYCEQGSRFEIARPERA